MDERRVWNTGRVEVTAAGCGGCQSSVPLSASGYRGLLDDMLDPSIVRDSVEAVGLITGEDGAAGETRLT